MEMLFICFLFSLLIGSFPNIHCTTTTASLTSTSNLTQTVQPRTDTLSAGEIITSSADGLLNSTTSPEKTDPAPHGTTDSLVLNKTTHSPTQVLSYTSSTTGTTTTESSTTTIKHSSTGTTYKATSESDTTKTTQQVTESVPKKSSTVETQTDSTLKLADITERETTTGGVLTSEITETNIYFENTTLESTSATTTKETTSNTKTGTIKHTTPNPETSTNSVPSPKPSTETTISTITSSPSYKYTEKESLTTNNFVSSPSPSNKPQNNLTAHVYVNTTTVSSVTHDSSNIKMNKSLSSSVDTGTSHLLTDVPTSIIMPSAAESSSAFLSLNASPATVESEMASYTGSDFAMTSSYIEQSVDIIPSSSGSIISSSNVTQIPTNSIISTYSDDSMTFSTVLNSSIETSYPTTFSTGTSTVGSTSLHSSSLQFENPSDSLDLLPSSSSSSFTIQTSSVYHETTGLTSSRYDTSTMSMSTTTTSTLSGTTGTSTLSSLTTTPSADIEQLKAQIDELRGKESGFIAAIVILAVILILLILAITIVYIRRSQRRARKSRFHGMDNGEAAVRRRKMKFEESPDYRLDARFSTASLGEREDESTALQTFTLNKQKVNNNREAGEAT